MAATIYHNPRCSTSRKALAMLETSGGGPVTVVEYLKTGWSLEQLKALFSAAGLSARQALRTKQPEAEQLGLLAPGVSEATILKAMVAHPVLVERPFVTTAKGTRLGRPLESLQTILP